MNSIIAEEYVSVDLSCWYSPARRDCYDVINRSGSYLGSLYYELPEKDRALYFFQIDSADNYYIQGCRYQLVDRTLWLKGPACSFRSERRAILAYGIPEDLPGFIPGGVDPLDEDRREFSKMCFKDHWEMKR